MGEHGQYRALVIRAALRGAVAALTLAASPAAADCRIALSLAIDVSASVDAAEYALIRGGLAAALVAPEVRAAFLAVPGRVVALHVYEWSGVWQQARRLGWTMIATEADLETAAARIAAMTRSQDEFPTAIGNALGYGATALADSPDCARRVLDVSGDGIGNAGIGPEAVDGIFPMAGVQVNGLVIGGDPAVARYYMQRVVRGPGAFVEPAADYADFERAMRRKLVRELTVPNLSRRDPGPRYEMFAAGDGQRRPPDGGPAGDAAPGIRR